MGIAATRMVVRGWGLSCNILFCSSWEPCNWLYWALNQSTSN